MMSPDDYQALGEVLCNRLIAEMRKLGFPRESLSSYPVFNQAEFTNARDPFSGLEGLTGVWKNTRGYRIGEIKLHGDGSFYAEYDVALPHPLHKHRWFVEAVVAWGRGNMIKTEAKLLPTLGE